MRVEVETQELFGSVSATAAAATDQVCARFWFSLVVPPSKRRMPTMISDIPDDLLLAILCRLPVKSITRCKCVCKLWRTLVATTRFIEFHLSRTNQETPNLIVASSRSAVFYSLASETCDEVVDLNLCSPFLAIIGSCNGLICLWGGRSSFYLCNPSTREYVQLDSLVQWNHINENERSTVAVGFGYDSVATEYKMVRIEYFFDIYGPGTMTEFDRCEVCLYTLGTNSWRIISGTAPPRYIVSFTRAVHSAAVHFAGVLYWVGLRHTGKELSKSIISFDLSSEKFGEVPWPEFGEVPWTGFEDPGLGVFQGRLCTFSYHLGRVDIWVARDYSVENSWSWTRKFSIARSEEFLRPLLMRKSGEILLQTGARDLVLYNPVDKVVRVPSIRGIPEIFRCITYVESLVSIASLMGMAGNRV